MFEAPGEAVARARRGEGPTLIEVQTDRGEFSTTTSTRRSNRARLSASDRPRLSASDRPRLSASDRPRLSASDRPRLSASDRPRLSASDRPRRRRQGSARDGPPW
jgi:hypothetical protein